MSDNFKSLIVSRLLQDQDITENRTGKSIFVGLQQKKFLNFKLYSFL